MANAKILYGVCGIGNGHTYRQLPLIDHFCRGNQLVIFAYGASYKFYREHCRGRDNVTVLPVSVPFYVGNAGGLDFAATAALPANQVPDRLAINCSAMERAQALIGKPDLVVSDYEPVCARYAYAHGAPFVTIDQQSKYLVGDFPEPLGEEYYRDEVARLRMFFPSADARIACSFFRVPERKERREEVLLYPPILKPDIVGLQRQPIADSSSILVYISSQKEFVQELWEVVRICATQSSSRFHMFLPASIEYPAQDQMFPNVTFYRHGDLQFAKVLRQCTGLITTGGHSLLSEAMHLGIPAYVIPLPVYEQQMNGHVIGKHGFGVCHPLLEAAELGRFLQGLPGFAQTIKDDKEVLLRGSGEQSIIAYLTGRFLG